MVKLTYRLSAGLVLLLLGVGSVTVASNPGDDFLVALIACFCRRAASQK